MTDKPEHTPEEIEQAREDAELLGDYAGVVRAGVQGAVQEHAEALAAGDKDATIAAIIKKETLLKLLALVVAVGIILGATFFLLTNGSGDRDGSSGGDTDTPAAGEAPGDSDSGEAPSQDVPPADPGSEPAEEQPVEEPGTASAPAHFVGTIVSDNGWFTMTVAADGSVSGGLLVEQEVEGGTVRQSGTFAGAIDEDNLITAAGGFTGVSTDEEGKEYPHSGAVAVTAKPTSDDLSTWEISADGDPGDLVVLPASAR